MKRISTLALAAWLLAGAGPLAAQEFHLSPEPGADADVAAYSCPELDREITKIHKYIDLVSSEVSFSGEDAPEGAGSGAFAQNDSLGRGEALDRANTRLNTLESARLEKGCPGDAPE